MIDVKVIFVQKVIVLQPTDKSKFLVLKRNPDDFSRPGDIDIPGGRARFTEIHTDAMVREVNEETGLEITNLKPLVVSSRLQPDESIYFLYIGYVADALSDAVKINDEEHESYEWYDLASFVEDYPEHILTSQVRELL